MFELAFGPLVSPALGQLVTRHGRIAGAGFLKDLKGTRKICTPGPNRDVVRCVVRRDHLSHSDVDELIEGNPFRLGQIASRFEQGRL